MLPHELGLDRENNSKIYAIKMVLIRKVCILFQQNLWDALSNIAAQKPGSLATAQARPALPFSESTIPAAAASVKAPTPVTKKKVVAAKKPGLKVTLFDYSNEIRTKY